MCVLAFVYYHYRFGPVASKRPHNASLHRLIDARRQAIRWPDSSSPSVMSRGHKYIYMYTYYIYTYVYKHATLSDSQYPLGYLIHSFSLRGGVLTVSRGGSYALG